MAHRPAGVVQPDEGRVQQRRIQPGQGRPGSNPVRFRIIAIDDPAVAVDEKSTFYIPR